MKLSQKIFKNPSDFVENNCSDVVRENRRVTLSTLSTGYICLLLKDNCPSSVTVTTKRECLDVPLIRVEHVKYRKEKISDTLLQTIRIYVVLDIPHMSFENEIVKDVKDGISHIMKITKVTRQETEGTLEIIIMGNIKTDVMNVTEYFEYSHDEI